MTHTCYPEHGVIFWAALDELKLSEDPDLLAPIANALRGRVGATRQYANIEPPVVGVSIKDGVEKVHRSPRLFPRSFEWKESFSVTLDSEAASLLKKGLKALKDAKQRNGRGEETGTPVLSGCDAAAYVECCAMVEDWIRGAVVRNLESVPDTLPEEVEA